MRRHVGFKDFLLKLYIVVQVSAVLKNTRVNASVSTLASSPVSVPVHAHVKDSM